MRTKSEPAIKATVIEVDIDQVFENPENPRTIKAAAFKKLVKSIEEFPQMLLKRPPVCETVADGRYMALGGNKRSEAARKAGLKRIPIMLADDWTAEQKKRFVVLDNDQSGEWDFKMLVGQYDMSFLLESTSIALPQSMFKGKGLTDPDAAPPAPKVAVSRLGDVWCVGPHRILCGDSTKEEVIDKLMNGDMAVLVCADPPYGMGKEKDGIANDNLYNEKLDAFQMAWWKAARTHTADNASVYVFGNAEDLWRWWFVAGLNKTERMEYRNEIAWFKGGGGFGVGTQSQRSYFPSERCLFFMLGAQSFNVNSDNYWEGWEPVRRYLEESMRVMGWKPSDLSRITGTNMGGHWVGRSQWAMPTREHYEAIQAQAKADAFKRDYDALKRDWQATRAYFDNAHDAMTDVWEFSAPVGDNRHGHATPKPVGMIERMLKSSAPEGGIVLDPFSGSGTTLIACEETGRVARVIDIAPEYVDVAVRRWQVFTGKEATLEGDGRTFAEVSAERLGKVAALA